MFRSQLLPISNPVGKQYFITPEKKRKSEQTKTRLLSGSKPVTAEIKYSVINGVLIYKRRDSFWQLFFFNFRIATIISTPGCNK